MVSPEQVGEVHNWITDKRAQEMIIDSIGKVVNAKIMQGGEPPRDQNSCRR